MNCVPTNYGLASGVALVGLLASPTTYINPHCFVGLRSIQDTNLNNSDSQSPSINTKFKYKARQWFEAMGKSMGVSVISGNATQNRGT
jgi:hypothetical protein